ncbi:DMT family transporter [Xanthobacter sp. VNH20]|uniref:DMT family transporter n=1 Tax=Xanthobacter sp. VNH20 TaxID=3156616 RepID=UPI0032B3FA2A
MSLSPLRRLGHRINNAPYLLLSITALLWACNMVLGRFVAGQIPPISLACLRWAGATLILLPFSYKQVLEDWPLVRRNWLILVLLSACGIACYNAMSYYGLQYTQALNGLLVQSASPLLIALWSLLLFRDRLSKGQIAGIIISLLGVVVIVSRGDIDVLLHLKPNVGDIWIITALLIYAFYAANLRVRPPMRSLSFLTVIMGMGAVLLIPFALWEIAQGHILHFNRTTLSVLAFVMTAPSLLAYMAFNRGVELVGANRAAPFFHLMPVFGSALAILVLGERLEWFHGVGYALVIAGIATATRARAAAPA